MMPPDLDRLRMLRSTTVEFEGLLAEHGGEPSDWPLSAKLRLYALWLDKYDLDRGVYDRTEVQTDVRRAAATLEWVESLADSGGRLVVEQPCEHGVFNPHYDGGSGLGCPGGSRSVVWPTDKEGSA